MIFFQLKDPLHILPAGQEPNAYLSWFYLTDGHLRLRLGQNILYEYTAEAMAYFGEAKTPYNDYYLARFTDDFSALFSALAEPVPEYLYAFTSDPDALRHQALRWLERKEDTDESRSDTHIDTFHILTSWIDRRTLYAGHLTGGPRISFFRHADEIRIVWYTDQVLANGVRLWTADNGKTELPYAAFVHEIQVFAKSFFERMEEQIVQAVKKVKSLIVDEQQLYAEQQERKSDFYTCMNFLHAFPASPANWEEIITLHKQVRQELE